MGVLLLREILDRQLLLTLIQSTEPKLGKSQISMLKEKTRWDQTLLSNENLLYEAQVETW